MDIQIRFFPEPLMHTLKTSVIKKYFVMNNDNKIRIYLKNVTAKFGRQLVSQMAKILW